MTRLLGILLALALASGFASAKHFVMKRQVDMSSSIATGMEGILGTIEELPLVGGIVKDSVDTTLEMVELAQNMTNGVLGRTLGGALPCTISLTEGTTCSGVGTSGGMGKMIMRVVNAVPLLPSIFKWMIGIVIASVVDPTIDVTFGGLPITK